MPATQIYKTPGVYVAEIPAFPPSVVGVATAVPIFIGYTENAAVGGKPVTNKPVFIDSLAAYQEVFGGAYRAVYTLAPVNRPTANNYDFRVLRPAAGDAPADAAKGAGDEPADAPKGAGDEPAGAARDPAAPAAPPTYEYAYYSLVAAGTAVPAAAQTEADASAMATAGGGKAVPAAAADADPAPLLPRFNLYNSMRLFYANGGGNCYVVSVGTYADAGDTGVTADALGAGLEAAGEQVGPTMTVVPDAVLLPPKSGEKPWISSDFATVATAMLAQASRLQDRIAILDVYGAQYANSSEYPRTLSDVVGAFHEAVADVGLSYGAAYFPFLDTSVIPLSEISYANIDNTGGALTQILTWENDRLYGDDEQRRAAVQGNIARLSPDNPGFPTTDAEIRLLNNNLVATLPVMKTIEQRVIAKNDVLPPSGAMAGVYTRVDATSGVWNAPANVQLASVDRPTLRVNADQQADLNVPVNGKAIDVLRAFPGRGTVVWGARTLDGNSPDFRYVQVRRTLIYLEQSIKAALEPFVFAPNTGQTWATVTSMVSGFLTGVWSRGGLMGAKPSDAFSVACGVGSTMTGTDVLEGYMIVQVTLSLIRPAEFIELTFKQTMQGVG
jgi:phage tail sheath protein FI